MRTRVRFAGMAAVALLLAGVSMSFGQTMPPMPPVPPVPPVPGAEQPAPPPLSTGVTKIIGSAWDRDGRPIASAEVRLRDITSGRMVSRTTTDAAGEFTFTGVGTGSYVAELLDNRDNVMGLSEVFRLEQGQSVVTVIRPPGAIARRDAPAEPRRFGGTSRWGLIAAAAGAAVLLAAFLSGQ